MFEVPMRRGYRIWGSPWISHLWTLGQSCHDFFSSNLNEFIQQFKVTRKTICFISSELEKKNLLGFLATFWWLGKFWSDGIAGIERKWPKCDGGICWFVDDMECKELCGCITKGCGTNGWMLVAGGEKAIPGPCSLCHFKRAIKLAYNFKTELKNQGNVRINKFNFTEWNCLSFWKVRNEKS